MGAQTTQKGDLQVLKVGQLEDLGWDGGEAVAVELEDLQATGQVDKAAYLQRGNPVVVKIADSERSTQKIPLRFI